MRTVFAGALAGTLAGLLAFVAPAAAQGFSPEQRQEVVGILREALRQDPGILREALAALEAAEVRDREGAQRVAIAAHGEALYRNAADPVKGNPQGAVTIVESSMPVAAIASSCSR
ncbi:hypothetical protein ACFQY5_04605 [Paeniroseomonas aquatica]|uniref:hypothetical protein n=1 Tax=Paeniroseomonas aquatica TaxID=373043 RepID=UPI00361654D5